MYVHGMLKSNSGKRIAGGYKVFVDIRCHIPWDQASMHATSSVGDVHYYSGKPHSSGF